MPTPFLRSLRLKVPEDTQTYPFSIPLFAQGLSIDFTTPITIIVGENGSGKSTLLEAIAAHCGFNLTGGGVNHVYTQRSDIQPLVDAIKLGWLPKVNKGFFFRAESFFNFANYIDDLASDPDVKAMDNPLQSYGNQSLHNRSHGEAFFSLFQSRHQGLFILDEPEAALSPTRQIQFLAHLRSRIEGGKMQVIMATHSPILMAYPGAQFLHLKDGVLEPTTWQETEHYKTYRRFLENPQAYLDMIFTQQG